MHRPIVLNHVDSICLWIICCYGVIELGQLPDICLVCLLVSDLSCDGICRAADCGGYRQRSHTPEFSVSLMASASQWLERAHLLIILGHSGLTVDSEFVLIQQNIFLRRIPDFQQALGHHVHLLIIIWVRTVNITPSTLVGDPESLQ